MEINPRRNNGSVKQMSSSDAAKAAERKMLDAEIAYFDSAIASHKKQISYFSRFLSFFGLKKRAEQEIAEDQAGIDALESAKQRYLDLEKYYTTIGRL